MNDRKGIFGLTLLAACLLALRINVHEVQAATVAPNDNFADAIEISSNEAFLHARFAGTTVEAGEPPVIFGTVETTNTVWWSYSAQKAGFLVFQREFGTAQALWYAVYKGSAFSNLARMGVGGDRGL